MVTRELVRRIEGEWDDKLREHYCKMMVPLQLKQAKKGYASEDFIACANLSDAEEIVATALLASKTRQAYYVPLREVSEWEVGSDSVDPKVRNKIAREIHEWVEDEDIALDEVYNLMPSEFFVWGHSYTLEPLSEFLARAREADEPVAFEGAWQCYTFFHPDIGLRTIRNKVFHHDASSAWLADAIEAVIEHPDVSVNAILKEEGDHFELY
jgi:hypothetical protein